MGKDTHDSVSRAERKAKKRKLEDAVPDLPGDDDGMDVVDDSAENSKKRKRSGDDTEKEEKKSKKDKKTKSGGDDKERLRKRRSLLRQKMMMLLWMVWDRARMAHQGSPRRRERRSGRPWKRLPSLLQVMQRKKRAL